MRVAYIAAGAAGMYCGTCIHDNTLAAALRRQGVDVALIPTYTPLRTDEEGVALNRVFYGGINVYLQQKWSLFRHTPRAVDRLLDSPHLLGSLGRFSASTSAADLGALTVSVLQGEEGRQHKELERLVAWLKSDFKPDVVHLTNAMFAGMGHRLKQALSVPVFCGLQGEDIFLEQLIEPFRTQARDILRQRAANIDAFIAPCAYYQHHMADFMQCDPERIRVVPLGLNLDGTYKVDYADNQLELSVAREFIEVVELEAQVELSEEEGEADDGEVVMGSAAMFDLVIGRMVRGPAFSQLPADKQAAAAEQIAALKALFVKAQQQPSWTTGWKRLTEEELDVGKG